MHSSPSKAELNNPQTQHTTLSKQSSPKEAADLRSDPAAPKKTSVCCLSSAVFMSNTVKSCGVQEMANPEPSIKTLPPILRSQQSPTAAIALSTTCDQPRFQIKLTVRDWSTRSKLAKPAHRPLPNRKSSFPVVLQSPNSLGKAEVVSRRVGDRENLSPQGVLSAAEPAATVVLIIRPHCRLRKITRPTNVQTSPSPTNHRLCKTRIPK